MKMRSELRKQVAALRHFLSCAAVSGRAGARARFVDQWSGARLHSNEDGSQLVEFAVVVPVFLLLITGMFSVVMALITNEQLGNAAAVAAQPMQTGRGLLTDPCQTVVTAATAALPNFTASKLTYTVTITDASGTVNTYGPTTGSGFSCTAAAAVLAANEPATVLISYPYKWIPAYLLNLGTTTMQGFLAVSVS